MASEVTCGLKSLPEDMTAEHHGITQKCTFLSQGGLFEALLSSLFGFFFLQPLQMPFMTQHVTSEGESLRPLLFLPRNRTASCLSSWEAVLRVFITICVQMLQKRPDPSRLRFYKEMLLLCFVAIVIVCAVQNVTTSTICANNIVTG